MALISRDETDLLLPLHQGVHEAPRFSTFLSRLRRRTSAEFVGIIVRKAGDPKSRITEYFSGIDLRSKARELGIHELYTLDGIYRERLRPGRVYSVAEFTDHDPAYRDQRARYVERLGISDERVVRVSNDDQISAWLVLARAKQCSAADSALLSNLAPYVSAVVESLVLTDRQRIEAAVTSEGLRRSGSGWVLFDDESRVVAVDPATDRQLQSMAGIEARPGHRLFGASPPALRTLADTASEIARAEDYESRTVVLSEAPRVEALLTSASDIDGTELNSQTMLALCRFPRDPSPTRSTRLAELFDLPRREAELAISLSDGHSIAEAAQAMGLTLETARNYSKRLYTKLGVRGQAELVRKVYESSAVLA